MTCSLKVLMITAANLLKGLKVDTTLLVGLLLVVLLLGLVA